MSAAQAFRRRMVDDTGLDPTPALAELEQKVAAGTVAAGITATTTKVAKPDGPMVGRQHDHEEVLRLLGTNATVTVTGPGGVGKTRLALDIAADPGPSAPADVVVVDVAVVDRPEQVPQACCLDARSAHER